MTTDRLSALDTSFLRAEKETTPLHVGAVSVFEGGPLTDEDGHVRLDLVRAAVAARLGLLPRLRQVVKEVPLGLALPVWVDDPHFDIAHHVRSITLPPPGDHDQLLALATELHEERLDRTRPLWELWVVDGLQDGRIALVEKIHHAMVDGVSGVDVATAILDLTPDAVVGDASPLPPIGTIGPVQLVAAAFGDAAGRLLRRPPTLGQVVAAGRRLVSEVAALEEGGVLAPRCSLNRGVGSERRLAALTVRLDDVKRAGRPYGATVNDVVLAAVAGGVGALLAGRGERLQRPLKVLVPVSLRTADETMALGNRVGALLAPLHSEIDDDVARLVATAAWTHRAKLGGGARTTADLLAAADELPPLVISILSRLVVSRQPFVNLVVTNVPGPPCPVFLLGARMLESVPIVPLGGNLTVEVAVLSYDGQLTLGFNADIQTCPDLDVMVERTAGVFEALASAAVARSA